MRTADLFEDSRAEALCGSGLVVLPGFALSVEQVLLEQIERVAGASPFRHMATPGGQRMSAAMTNCGEAGWVTDRSGYRYVRLDPQCARPWPVMPAAFARLAREAAAQAGFEAFEPDACLINCYAPGARMSLHQDRDERDLEAPIVSVSLGLPATFLWGGLARAVRPRRILLSHGDVAVWGGPSRLVFHGVAPLQDGRHELMGRRRINLTLRRAL